LIEVVALCPSQNFPPAATVYEPVYVAQFDPSFDEYVKVAIRELGASETSL
jgi:hypothetical protein